MANDKLEDRQSDFEAGLNFFRWAIESILEFLKDSWTKTSVALADISGVVPDEDESSSERMARSTWTLWTTNGRPALNRAGMYFKMLRSVFLVMIVTFALAGATAAFTGIVGNAVGNSLATTANAFLWTIFTGLAFVLAGLVIVPTLWATRKGKPLARYANFVFFILSTGVAVTAYFIAADNLGDHPVSASLAFSGILLLVLQGFHGLIGEAKPKRLFVLIGLVMFLAGTGGLMMHHKGGTAQWIRIHVAGYEAQNFNPSTGESEVMVGKNLAGELHAFSKASGIRFHPESGTELKEPTEEELKEIRGVEIRGAKSKPATHTESSYPRTSTSTESQKVKLSRSTPSVTLLLDPHQTSPLYIPENGWRGEDWSMNGEAYVSVGSGWVLDGPGRVTNLKGTGPIQFKAVPWAIETVKLTVCASYRRGVSCLV